MKLTHKDLLQFALIVVAVIPLAFLWLVVVCSYNVGSWVWSLFHNEH